MLRRLPTAARRQATATAAYSTKASAQYTSPLGVKLSPSRQRLIPTSGTYPRGFEANAVTAGIKASNKTRPDMALLASRAPCSAAAVFTKNKFQAAPVLYSRSVLERAGNLGVHGVVVNSGCANAVTGKGGRDDAVATGAAMDAMLQGPGSTLVMSTGVIGQR
jgi:glutamate N-acetyltransferase/amino-acid N-acetyltransferase